MNHSTLFFILLILNLNSETHLHAQKIRVGAEVLSAYLPLLKNKKVALVVNQSSKVGKTALLDTLLSEGVWVRKIFVPEHGFRGDKDAGQTIASHKDPHTKLPILSLYGKHKKPRKQNLEDVEVIVFDLQDVGVRFYTYISTLHYVMEAAAEQGIPIIVLDRPNPNDDYVAGPLLDLQYRSFVGMHPVPIVYGMTIGEYALMINGQGWLNGGISANLSVIRCKNHTRNKRYTPPVKPSPNLPNVQAILWYPSLCLFEGTNVSVGRGTAFPFQVFGSPFLQGFSFEFYPSPKKGAKHPKHKGKICYGTDLRSRSSDQKIHLEWLLKAFAKNARKPFFNTFFTKLAGSPKLQRQIEKGIDAETIRKSWQKDLKHFIKIRKRYLLYR